MELKVEPQILVLEHSSEKITNVIFKQSKKLIATVISSVKVICDGGERV